MGFIITNYNSQNLQKGEKNRHHFIIWNFFPSPEFSRQSWHLLSRANTKIHYSDSSTYIYISSSVCVCVYTKMCFLRCVLLALFKFSSPLLLFIMYVHHVCVKNLWNNKKNRVWSILLIKGQYWCIVFKYWSCLITIKNFQKASHIIIHRFDLALVHNSYSNQSFLT